MKNTYFPISTWIVFSLLASCKKDVQEATCHLDRSGLEITDTIHPSEYLMSYPGSWWSYSNGYHISADGWHEQVITLHDHPDTCTLYKVIIPHGSMGLIYGQNYCSPKTVFKATNFTPILDTVPGEFFQTVTGSQVGKQTTTRYCEGFIDTLTVSGTTYNHVLVIRQFDQIYYYHVGGGPYYETHWYYVSGVGPIRKTYVGVGGYPADTMDLVDHYIAPH